MYGNPKNHREPFLDLILRMMKKDFVSVLCYLIQDELEACTDMVFHEK